MSRQDEIKGIVEERIRIWMQNDLFDFGFWDGLWTDEPQPDLLTEDEIANLGNWFDFEMKVTKR